MQSLLTSNDCNDTLREGDAVLLKVSGNELEGKGFNELLRYISCLQRKRLKTVLVYGGGMQIDRAYYNLHKSERQRMQSKASVDEAVRKAYFKIRRHLNDWIPAIQFADSFGIQVYEDEIDVSDASLREEFDSITAFGFIGTDGETNYNLNADSVACALIQQFQSIRRAIFCTDVGCIYGKDKKRIPVIHSHHIQDDGSHTFIETSAGIRPKLLACKKSGLSEVLITSATKLRENMDVREMHRESGTIVRNTQGQ
jgi:acetylglutamate kinase